MEKTITLIGVTHSIDFLNQKAKEFLEEKIKTEQIIGIEISKKVIAKFEKAYAQKEVCPYLFDLAGEYFYEIFKMAKEKKCLIVPLTDSKIISKYAVANYQRLLGKKYALQRNYYITAIQDKTILKHIIKSKPDLCIIGNAHLGIVYKHLISKGIPAKKIVCPNSKYSLKEKIKNNRSRLEYIIRQKLRKIIREKYTGEKRLKLLGRNDLFSKIPETRKKYSRMK